MAHARLLLLEVSIGGSSEQIGNFLSDLAFTPLSFLAELYAHRWSLNLQMFISVYFVLLRYLMKHYTCLFHVSQRKQPAMSSVPTEILRDELQPLDRWRLGRRQSTSRRFLQLILGRKSHVCLRRDSSAVLVGPFSEFDDLDPFGAWHLRSSRRRLSCKHKNTTRLFAEFTLALRSSCVEELTLNCKYAAVHLRSRRQKGTLQLGLLLMAQHVDPFRTCKRTG